MDREQHFSVTDAVNEECAAADLDDSVAVSIMGNSHASRELIARCLSRDICLSLSERVLQTQCLLTEECLLNELLLQCNVTMTATEQTEMMEAAAVDLIKQWLPHFDGRSLDLIDRFCQ